MASINRIDFHYESNIDGSAIKEDLLGREPNGANLLRIWFSAAGVGIGIRPGLHKNHRSAHLLARSVPTRYQDLLPAATAYDVEHSNKLLGVQGKENHYLAVLYQEGFTNDELFLKQLLACWDELQPALLEHRC